MTTHRIRAHWKVPPDTMTNEQYWQGIKEAYSRYLGYDCGDLTQELKQKFALMPPDPDQSDFDFAFDLPSTPSQTRNRNAMADILECGSLPPAHKPVAKGNRLTITDPQLINEANPTGKRSAIQADLDSLQRTHHAYGFLVNRLRMLTQAMIDDAEALASGHTPESETTLTDDEKTLSIYVEDYRQELEQELTESGTLGPLPHQIADYILDKRYIWHDDRKDIEHE